MATGPLSAKFPEENFRRCLRCLRECCEGNCKHYSETKEGMKRYGDLSKRWIELKGETRYGNGRVREGTKPQDGEK
jgi:hypothetical protein